MSDASHDQGQPRKLTEAEAGRLGGNRTNARHGRDHYVRAGKLGFQAFARLKGFQGGARLGALQWLIRTGRIRMSAQELARIAEAEASCEALVEQVADRIAEEEATRHDQR